MVGSLAGMLLAAATPEPEQSTTSITFLSVVGVVLIALVIPYLIGRYSARALRMPDFDWKIALILGSIFSSLLVLVTGWPPKLGIDLKGGVILVYEVDVSGRSTAQAKSKAAATGDEHKINMKDLVAAVNRRINPDGLKEIVTREFGSQQIEIIIPDVDPLEIARIKKSISTAGMLEFRIVANGTDHGPVIELAKLQAQDPRRKSSRTVRDASDKDVAFWARVGREEKSVRGKRAFKVQPWNSTIRNAATGDLIEITEFAEFSKFNEDPIRFVEYLERRGIGEIEILMFADDKFNVTGSDLGAVSAGFENLDPKVDFTTKTPDAARRMGALTGSNMPEGNFARQLGIVLDGTLLSAPSIRGTISDRGQITGRFSQDEVDVLVNVLRAGQLPAALHEEPVSENQIGSLLGADMILKSAWALIGSLIAVLAFALIYYRFSGLIACFALIINLVLTVAIMMLFNAAFTLPGLAGLVLTVGMAVDANVLIYERMREEQARGAALRMTIRNGFDRAFITILDSNLTTVLTAIILYVIGTDQICGFAVTLTFGILTSMFTAIFCSRVLFEICERRRILTDLKMMRLLTTTNIDFMAIWKTMTAVSVVLIAIGMIGVVARGKGILDVDFLGGTSVQPLLKSKMGTQAVRERLDKDLTPDRIQFTLTNMEVQGRTSPDEFKERVYKIDTSIEKRGDLETRLKKIFQDESGQSLLATYSMKFSAPIEVKIPGRVGPAVKGDGASNADAEKKTETQPKADKPADASPSSEKPAEEKAGAEKATEKSDADKGAKEKPCLDGEEAVQDDAKPEDKKPEDKKPEDKKPEDKKPEPAKAEEKKPADAKPNDEKPETEKPSDTKPASEKPADEKPPQAPATEGGAGSGAPPKDGGAALPQTPEAVEIESDLTFETPINEPTLADRINDSAKALGLLQPAVKLSNPSWKVGSTTPYTNWTVRLTTTSEDAHKILEHVQKVLAETPVFLSSSEIGGQVAGDTQERAIAALLLSLVGIVAYIWFRFQRVVWGLAAVLALVHDVLMTIGAIALSKWLAPIFGFAGIDEFKINLTVVAAILTLVGYSINDTIVTFDRIREVKGKSPHITPEMINLSVNQTLSRTILTALTVFLVVLILYFVGGDSIHGFAFSLVVGTIVGSYSSIFIAAPVLLAMGEAEQDPQSQRAAQNEKTLSR